MNPYTLRVLIVCIIIRGNITVSTSTHTRVRSVHSYHFIINTAWWPSILYASRSFLLRNTIHFFHSIMVRPSISSSSGAVSFERVGCHDPPWLLILSKSHEVFVSHPRPFCDVCHPLRSWPSSADQLVVFYI